ncbi:Capping protein inhibiting regulator of actin dynamics [Frankliniella fusca]|uniref:Capping protein inhibiting regulator of actin dynamics n=1 Tax=Frankliniella fusca TaxID=407009 RepID=A0AAE1LP78_9NEOP|nr:Capping protein inhibiting regulator of actin dynamics [Frankliniella fusca]
MVSAGARAGSGSAEEEAAAADERDPARCRSPFGAPFVYGGATFLHHHHHPLGASPPSRDPVGDQSTCSDGSLLSMGSSDLDEDSCGQNSSRHSSKLSLQDKRSASADGGDLEVCVSTTPLSHSAARHKMAVKPKRTHGAPRRRRIPQLSSAPALPATPELNEEPNGSGRSISPELSTSQIGIELDIVIIE